MKILCVVGTRPEAIKMAPVIHELKSRSWAEVAVLSTSQHKELLESVLKFFEISPDYDLHVMTENQTLSSTFAKILTGTDEVLRDFNPDLILVQGDTTTVLAASMAGFYAGVKVGHVEAGLRTGDINYPFPEEANRVLTSRIVTYHFAPTAESLSNLLNEGVPSKLALETGNTVIDALLMARDKLKNSSSRPKSLNRTVLVTVHRRENFGKPLENIAAAILRLAREFRDVEFCLPVHPNPQVRSYLTETLKGQENIVILAPLAYPDLVSLMDNSYFVITDSGGIQEEAPALGKPVIILRNETERAEAVTLGGAVLVGSDENLIVSHARRILTDSAFHASMVLGYSPYGDGAAAKRIADFIESKQ